MKSRKTITVVLLLVCLITFSILLLPRIFNRNDLQKAAPTTTQSSSDTHSNESSVSDSKNTTESNPSAGSLTIPTSTPSPAEKKNTETLYCKWVKSNGVNVSARVIIEKDISDLSSLGCKLIRLVFASTPLMDKMPPYGFNQNAFEKMDKVINWCEKYNVKVIIDPHTFPGFKNSTYTEKNDVFWTDYKWHEYMISLWTKIAKKYAGKGHIIAGYDLINEPYIPNNGKAGTPADINQLYKRLVKEIRKYDKTHSILLYVPDINKPFKGFTRSYYNTGYMQLPCDNNLVLSLHYYEPYKFSFYGVLPQYAEKYNFPGWIGNVYWNKEKIEETLAEFKQYADNKNLPVFIGEFSAARWLGDEGNNYLKTLMDIFNSYGWNSAYHAFRESQVWDAERSNYDKEDTARQITTPRLEILKTFFKK